MNEKHWCGRDKKTGWLDTETVGETEQYVKEYISSHFTARYISYLDIVPVELNKLGKHPDTLKLKKLQEWIIKTANVLEVINFASDVCEGKPIAQAIDDTIKGGG